MVGKRLVFDFWLELFIEFLLWNFIKCVTEILCNRPQSLANGNIPELEKMDLNATFPINFVLTYDCNAGYRLQGGEPWRVCGKDGWLGTDPYCEEILCPDPGVPEHGSREGASFKVGAKVHFKCHTGYDLLGSAERYCTPNGKWTGELARCNAPTNYCPDPGIPINGMKIGDSYEEGATLKFRCRSGFFQHGTRERTCMNDRTWNGTETNCFGHYNFDNSQETGNDLSDELDDEGIIRACKKYIYAHNLPVRNRKNHRIFEISSNQTWILYFAFDVSDNMTRQNFKKGIDFAKAMVKEIGISEYGARVGASVFNDAGSTAYFYPMDGNSMPEVLGYLQHIEDRGSEEMLSTDLLLKHMIENLQLVTHFFEWRNCVLFIITDGKVNIGKSSFLEAEILKYRMNTEIFWIGFSGEHQKGNTLNKIVSSSQYGNKERLNVFFLKNYGSLHWMIQDIMNGTIDYSQCGLGMESKINNNTAENIGVKNSLQSWPWLAALFYKDPTGETAELELKCDGSIITENFILTAAQCLIYLDLDTLEFRYRSEEEIIVKLGLMDPRNENVVRKFQVETIHLHKDYTFEYPYDNDIALLKLKKFIRFNPYIRPVCLPPAVPLVEDNNPLYKSGEYGWIAYTAYPNTVLPDQSNVSLIRNQQVYEFKLRILPGEKCQSTSRYDISFSEQKFCAGGESVNAPCVRNAGGPFRQHDTNSKGNIYWTQVGVISWNIGCGTRNLYEYFTPVQRFRSWIDDQIKKSVPEWSKIQCK